MLQFYFLSVLLNLTAGLILIYVLSQDSLSASPSELALDVSGDEDSFLDGKVVSETKKSAGLSGLKELAVPFLSDKTLQLVVGILSVLTGLMKLLSPMQYDWPILGDFFPSVAGMVSGTVLLLDWYQNHSGIQLSLPPAIDSFYMGGRKYLGVFCIIAAVLHFIFPRALIL